MGKEICSECKHVWDLREEAEDQRCPECSAMSVSAKTEHDQMFALWRSENPVREPAGTYRCKCCEAAIEGDFGHCGKCENGECQECCDHDDIDDYSCLTCGKELLEDRMARAYDMAKDRMKYGD